MDLKIKELDLNIINPNRENWHKPDQGGSKIVVIGKPGTGKCMAKDTPILMYDYQIKLIQDIKINDYLRGDDNVPRIVQSITQGQDTLYKIKQYCGLHYIVNSEHILCLKNFLTEEVIEISVKNLLKNKMDILKDYGGYKISLFQNQNNLKYIENINKLKINLKNLKQPYFIENDEICILSLPQDIPSIYPITIEIYKELDDYYGFEIDGNGRYCLADGTVTHNTTLITSLLYEKRDIFPVYFITSGTEDSNGHYKKIVPSTFVYNKLDEKKIDDFIVRQKIAKKHLENPWAVLLLDDCTDDPKIFNKPFMQGLYKNGRHWKCLFLLSLQYCLDVKPVIRTNVDGTFILRETNLRNRKSLWENYAGVIPDFSLFCQIMDELTTDYTALYIHNATTSNNLEDCLFWYKAKPVPSDFKLGSKDYWKFHKNRFNENYSDNFIA
jgi:hypothetical protein